MKIFEVTRRVDVFDRQPIVALENLYNYYSSSYDEVIRAELLKEINEILHDYTPREYSLAKIFVDTMNHNIKNNIRIALYFSSLRNQYNNNDFVDSVWIMH